MYISTYIAANIEGIEDGYEGITLAGPGLIYEILLIAVSTLKRRMRFHINSLGYCAFPGKFAKLRVTNPHAQRPLFQSKKSTHIHLSDL